MNPYLVYQIRSDKQTLTIHPIKIVRHDSTNLIGYDAYSVPYNLLRCHPTIESATACIRQAYQKHIDDANQVIAVYQTLINDLEKT